MRHPLRPLSPGSGLLGNPVCERLTVQRNRYHWLGLSTSYSVGLGPTLRHWLGLSLGNLRGARPQRHQPNCCLILSATRKALA